jgi:integrase
VDFEVAYRRILRHMHGVRFPSKCYDAILLIQLRNGLRISEAVRAFLQFLRTRSVEVEVRLSKKRRPETRLAVIPKELHDVNLAECRELLEVDERLLSRRLRRYCIETFGFNTHSLRYAFITYLLRQGVNPSIVAKITKHSKLDFILRYTQERVAEEILREMG